MLLTNKKLDRIKRWKEKQRRLDASDTEESSSRIEDKVNALMSDNDMYEHTSTLSVQ